MTDAPNPDTSADATKQTAEGSYIAQASGPGASATIGYTWDQLSAILATSLSSAGAAAQAKIDDLAAQLRTSSDAVLGFLKTLKQESVPPEQLADKLTEIAQRYTAMMDRLAAFDADDAEAQKYNDQAREILAHAASSQDYDRADELLSKAEQAQQAASDKIEAAEHEAAIRRHRNQASTRDIRASASLTQLKYKEAATHFQAAADLVAGYDSGLELDYRVKAAEALNSQGDERGDNQSLNQAIDIYNALLQQHPRQQSPQEWAWIQGQLAISLSTLGGREAGTTTLELAVQANNEALKEVTLASAPSWWAAIQSNLGSSLSAIGERHPTPEKLQLAVAAFNESLKVFSPDAEPVQWAAAQTNLAAVFAILGTISSGPEQVKQLENAADAYANALTVCTREINPWQWANAKNNLGYTLQSLGALEPGTERLTQALTALQDALTVRTRDRAALEWATTQYNLGLTYRKLAEHETGQESLDRLNNAVTAFTLSLQERTSDRSQPLWAITQHGLGAALLNLALRETGPERRGKLKLAEEAFRNALKVFTPQQLAMQWSMALNNLSVTLWLEGQDGTGTSEFIEARTASHSVLDFYNANGMQPYTPSVQSRLDSLDELIASRTAS